MAPNILALRAYLARLENTSPTKACDICDPVTPQISSNYAPGDLGMPVTPLSASKNPFLAGNESERETDARVALDEREAMALAGGVSPAYAREFAVLQVARHASVEEQRWNEAINDAGVFLDKWGGVAEHLGWTARDIFGPHFTPSALAWALQGAQVIKLTAEEAHLSDDRTVARSSGEVSSSANLERLGA
jgi:hypothetical protein